MSKDNGNNNNNNRGKKSLKAKKSISSGSVLVQLYNNKKLVTKVDNMLDEGLTYDYIIEFCNSQNFNISKASLTNYKKKREEAIRTGTPLISLLDKRAKDNILYIANKETDTIGSQGQKGDEEESSGSDKQAALESINRKDKAFSHLEFLDELVQKSMKGLKAVDIVDMPLGMKAIELYAKITNNQYSGLSVAGLRELKLRQQARESAMVEVIMSYVPKEKHDELFKDLDEAEQRFYDNLDLTEEGRRATEVFNKTGVDI